MKIISQFVLCIVCLSAYSISHAKPSIVVKNPLKQQRFVIENQEITESSGLACSTRNKKILWTHNDSGHMPIIYALNNHGRDLGSYFIDGVESIDWEDMDAFEYQGRHYLLIADTGDNFRVLWEHRIFIVDEPTVAQQLHPTLTPAWTIVYQFENGRSYDVEAAAVDEQRNKVILLTKRHKPTLMFELPLKPEKPEQVVQAVKVAELPYIKNPSAVDISPDGRIMSINSYRRIHRFSRKTPQDPWHYQYSLKYKPMFQPEAMCLSRDSKNYYVTSEKRFDLLKIKIK